MRNSVLKVAKKNVVRELHEKKRRQKLDWIAEQLGIQKQEDWYAITGKQVNTLGDKILTRHYNTSLYTALQRLYPEFEWNPFHFRCVPLYHWQQKQNHKIALDWIAEQLNIETQQQWYSVTTAHVNDLGMEAFLRVHYQSSVAQALKSVYPQYEWDDSKFLKYQRRDAPTHRDRFDAIAQKLNIQQQEDWYLASGKQVKALGVKKLLDKHYSGSLFNALQSIYPEYDWNPLLSLNAPSQVWNSVSADTVKHTLDSIHNRESTLQHMQSRVYRRIIKRFGGIAKTMQLFYPTAAHALNSYSSAGELSVEALLQKVALVQKGVKIHGQSVDFYLPQLSVAIEFQGKQHYQDIYRGSVLDQKRRDSNKRHILKQLGITLVEVPYWWNKDFFTLWNTISSQRSTAAISTSF